VHARAKRGLSAGVHSSNQRTHDLLHAHDHNRIVPPSLMHPNLCVAPHPPQAAHATARMHFTLARRSCRRKHSDSIRDRRTDARTRTDRLPSSQKDASLSHSLTCTCELRPAFPPMSLQPPRLPCVYVRALIPCAAACRDCSARSCPRQTNMHQLAGANHAASEAILAHLIHLQCARNP
jgi:hypothetical protein